MAGNSRQDLFEIDVPAPLAKFQRSIRDVDNQIILRENEDARLLPRELVRRYEKELKRLCSEIDETDYDELRAAYEALKKEWSGAQLYLYHLKTQLTENDSDDLREIKRQIVETIQQRKRASSEAFRVKEQLKPFLPMVRRRDAIEARLKSHYAAVEHKRLDEEASKKLATEARWFAGLIVEKWTQLGYCYRYTVSRNGQQRTITDKVRIERCVVTPDSIQFKIMVSSVGVFGQTKVHLPYGVSVQDLVKPETLNELTIACERQVSSPHLTGANFVNGAWLEMSRNDFVDGLPRLVHYKAVMTRYPDNLKHKFPLPLGVMVGRKVNVVKLSDHPHLLINGQSGTGKSNTMHVVLSTLIQKHSPDEMRLALIDLKAGVELRRYADVPHTVGGLIKDLNKAAALLYQLATLINIRLEEIQKIGAMASDIESYNRYAPPEKHMPRIIIVFEEIQLIDRDKTLAKQIRQSLDIIASTGRAAGVQLILCTQASFSDVIPKITQSNISCKVLGSQETLGAALASGGSTKSQHLIQLPGRMLVKRGPDHIEVQMPYITEEDKAEAVEVASRWETPAPLDLPALPDISPEIIAQKIEAEKRTITPEIIVRYALDNLNGELNHKRMIEAGLHTEYGIGFHKLREMVNQLRSGGVITVEGHTYNVITTRGNIGKLVTYTALQA